jgi:putative hydrolase of the HAD superfamily
VKAVLFDSLGTLLELRPVPPRLREELARHGLEVSEAAAARAFAAEVDYYLEHHLEGRDAASLDRLRDHCAAVAAKALGVGRDQIGAVRSALLAAISFEAFPEAPGTLHSLRAAALRIVVASNWDCSLHAALADAGLDELVDAVVASAEVGAAKPARALFDAALEAAGCDATDAVFVGDSMERDVAGAQAAGIEAILLARSGAADSPHPAGGRPFAVARSLDEALSLILARG